MMNKLTIIIAAVAFSATAVVASAEQAAQENDVKAAAKQVLKNNFKFYGFIRNYFAYDTRNCVAGTGDLYMWLPKDEEINTAGEDMNKIGQFRFLSLTSRVGVDVSGLKIGKAAFGAKVEADFYAGLTNNGGTAQLRLRQAYTTITWNDLGKGGNGSVDLKMGQAWHPMAADLPDIFSLESGAPFNAFSRTPQVLATFGLSREVSLSAGMLWQMQYLSSGPKGTSADYMKFSIVPEGYFAVNFKKGGFLGRAGVDILSIKPRWQDTIDGTTRKVRDRITTVSPYIYLQYVKGKFAIKGKTIYGSAGEHVNLMSGYAVYDKFDAYNWKYTPLHSSSSWLTIAYGKKVKGALFLGYMKNLGTSRDVILNSPKIADNSSIYFQKNGSANIARMARIQPEVTFNVSKFTFGLEYMATGVHYGDIDKLSARCIPTEGLHWIWDHRIQGMIKFTF